MAVQPIELDILAHALQDRMKEKGLSLRDAAGQIGCSASTLGRLLKGAAAPNVPDTSVLLKAVNWLGRRLQDFEPSRNTTPTTLADVEVHLRALPGLGERDKEALISLVRAAHDAFRDLPSDHAVG